MSCKHKICACKSDKKGRPIGFNFAVKSAWVSSQQDDLPLGKVKHLRRVIKEHADEIIGMGNNVRDKLGGLQKHKKYRQRLRRKACRFSLTDR